MGEPAEKHEWSELFRALGQAWLEVLRAEAQALGADFQRSGMQLVRGLALLGAAAAISFWTAGVVVLVLIAVLAIWLKVWAAALVVAGIFALAAGLLAALGVRQLRRLDNPIADLRRRLSDHLDWWQERLLGGSPRLAAPPAATANAVRRGMARPSQPRPRIHPDDPLEVGEEDDL